ncbi:MAG: membrane protein of unknown function [Promethearchaeota archaeon]|nr:MAG: membrane protein of unknown function [Candidatus Lokiarchaeota archaeon]
MALQPYSLEYNVFLILTIILIVAKIFLNGYLLNKILKKTKEQGEFKIDFVFTIFLIVLGLLISRVIYFYYDFFLTFFNPDLLYIYPNVVFWKVATLIAGISQLVAVFFIDKILLKFKLKGIPAYILLIGRLIQFFYPINSAGDFRVASTIGTILMLIMIILPIIFIYIGIKMPQLRYYSILLAVGIIIYFIGSMIVSESIVAAFQGIFGAGARIFISFTSITLKIGGLVMMIYSSTKIYI